MELIEAIQISALKSVLKPDDDYFVRRVFRWYSEKFHTPLHTVEDLPLEDVLQTYFEVNFEHSTKRKLNKLVKDLCKTDEERAKDELKKKNRKPRQKKAEKKLSDDEFLNEIRKKAAVEVDVLKARDEARQKAAENMMEEIGDQDPLAIPEFENKFNPNLG